MNQFHTIEDFIIIKIFHLNLVSALWSKFFPWVCHWHRHQKSHSQASVRSGILKPALLSVLSFHFFSLQNFLICICYWKGLIGLQWGGVINGGFFQLSLFSLNRTHDVVAPANNRRDPPVVRGFFIVILLQFVFWFRFGLVTWGRGLDFSPPS